jgi:hypothetical protein
MAIHPILTESLKRLEEHYAKDERCVGMYLWGSLGNDTADPWSDVDASIVIRDEDFAAVKVECRAVCEALCGPIVAWLPEGESADSVNFAFLFDAEQRLHLYDFSVVNASHVKKTPWLRPQKIFFDPTGLLAEAAQREPAAQFVFKPEQLSHLIVVWWVYTYLNGKYYMRQDTYKMLYVQGVIFQTHMKVLHAFYPAEEWFWWARDVHRLPEAQQEEMLVYWPAREPDQIASALWKEMDLFSRDARAACEKWNLTYPDQMERAVRQHLAFMGLKP